MFFGDEGGWASWEQANDGTHPVVSVQFWSRLDKDWLNSRFRPYKLHLGTILCGIWTRPEARNRSIRPKS